MKKMIAILALFFAFFTASANVDANVKAKKTLAFVQPFDQSYNLDMKFIWYTDIDLTNPTGAYCDIWYRMNTLRGMFGGYSFSHLAYSGMYEFEYGITLDNQYFATIYSDMNR